MSNTAVNAESFCFKWPFAKQKHCIVSHEASLTFVYVQRPCACLSSEVRREDGKQTKQTEVVGICSIVLLFRLAKEGLIPRPDHSGEEIESQKKHICQSHSETKPPSCSMKVCQQTDPCLWGESKGWGRYEGLTRGKKETVDFWNSSLTTTSSDCIQV